MWKKHGQMKRRRIDGKTKRIQANMKKAGGGAGGKDRRIQCTVRPMGSRMPARLGVEAWLAHQVREEEERYKK